MKKGKRDEALNKTRVEFDESICLTDDQLEAAAGGGGGSSVGWGLSCVSENGKEKWTASFNTSTFFGLIPVTKKKTFENEEDAQNWLKSKGLY